MPSSTGSTREGMSVLVYLAGLCVIVGVAVSIAAPLLWPQSPEPITATADPERYRLEKEKELAYAAIKEAEFDLQMGKLSPDDHAALREKYEARALAALEGLERRG
jgi:hypothetical protein